MRRWRSKLQERQGARSACVVRSEGVAVDAALRRWLCTGVDRAQEVLRCTGPPVHKWNCAGAAALVAGAAVSDVDAHVHGNGVHDGGQLQPPHVGW